MKRMLTVLCITFACTSFAQTPEATPSESVTTPAPSETKEPPKAVVTNEPPPAPKAPPEPPSARDRMLGAVGIGFLGTANVLRASPEVTQGMFGQTVINPRSTVPIIGLRYWMKQRLLALELGIGAMTGSAYSDAPATPGVPSGQGPSTTELLIHLSVPLCIASTRHTILFVAPEFRGAFSRFEPDSSGAGVMTAGTWDVSLKAGAEIFFSFLGLDNLSIEAGVRAGLTHEARYTVTLLPLQGNSTTTTSSTRFATSLIANPWDLFTSTLSAKYYF